MTTIAKTKYLEFKSVLSPSGSDWYYVKRCNDSKGYDSAVVITTVVKTDNKLHFLLLKTSRPPLSGENKCKYCIESPAGLIRDENSKESIVDCIKKELLEEAGVTTNKIYIELTNSSTSSGLSSETITYATAVLDEYKTINSPIDDGGVILERFFVEVDKIQEFIISLDTSIYSVSSAMIAGVFMAQKRIKDFKLSKT